MDAGTGCDSDSEWLISWVGGCSWNKRMKNVELRESLGSEPVNLLIKQDDADMLNVLWLWWSWLGAVCHWSQIPMFASDCMHVCMKIKLTCASSAVTWYLMQRHCTLHNVVKRAVTDKKITVNSFRKITGLVFVFCIWYKAIASGIYDVLYRQRSEADDRADRFKQAVMYFYRGTLQGFLESKCKKLLLCLFVLSVHGGQFLKNYP